MSSLARGSTRWRCSSIPALPSNANTVKSFQCLSVLARRPQRESWAPSRWTRLLHHGAPQWQQATAHAEAEATQPASSPPSHTETGIITRFEDLRMKKLVSKRLVDTLTDTMKLETMTQVQSLTISEALTGADILAQAKTGTGKTIAFLLPVLQNILNHEPSLARPRQSNLRVRRYDQGSDSTLAIIISPTRELAEQIAVEARRLVAGTGLLVQTAVGGTAKSYHLRAMQTQGCHILVGTPGRLSDILTDAVSAPRLRAFVLDEADRLMDQGFWPEIQRIVSLLPQRTEQDRQTLLFSATLPPPVIQLARTTLKKNMHHVQTVQENDTPTIDRVKQTLVQLPGLENALPALLEILERAYTDNKPKGQPFKALVYFSTTAEVALAHQLLRYLDANPHLLPARLRALFQDKQARPKIFSIHAKLSQPARTRAADAFRAADAAIMVSSDVTARGLDFPNVTHVIQVGLPMSREDYVHRLGRTARAGREGEGWLLLPPPAAREMHHRLGRLPLTTLSPQHALVNASAAAAPEDTVENPYLTAVRAAAEQGRDPHSGSVISPETFRDAYVACMGPYQWSRDKQALVDMINQWAEHGWGMETPPPVRRRWAEKMDLARTEGLNVSAGRMVEGEMGGGRDDGSRGGGYGDRRGGGGYGDRRGGDGYGDRRGGDGYGDRRGGGGYGDRRGGGGYNDSRGTGFFDTESGGGYGDRRGGSGYGDRRSGGGYGDGRSGGGYGDSRGRNSSGRKNPWSGRGRQRSRR